MYIVTGNTFLSTYQLYLCIGVKHASSHGWKLFYLYGSISNLWVTILLYLWTPEGKTRLREISV